MHLVDLNEIPWQLESQGRRQKSLERGLTLWSFPGPGIFELQAKPHHTWVVLKGQGRLQLGKRVVAISGGITLWDLYESVATFHVRGEDELIMMDVFIENSTSSTKPQDVPGPPSIVDAFTNESIEPVGIPVEDSDVDDNVPSGEPLSAPPILDADPAFVSNAPRDSDPSSPSNESIVEREESDEDPPLPWVARLRPR